ncbi:MAG: type II toxin-antitoxin system RelE/ParE family toxin [Paludibacteraceae bacterium]|nr:type II toxin-antitoxin system RelE/ParE family toxin [Paludibacteraceae bacterium]
MPTTYVKYLVGTGLYEMRVSVGSNAYRTILFAMDSDNVITSTKIILFNGFLKKSTKDYDRQLENAKKILKDLEL